jgi:hypothetical protein
MKWFTFFVGVVLLLSLRSVSPAAEPVEITSLSYTVVDAGEESLSISLSGALKAKVFRLNGDKPRVVLDFDGALYRGKNSLTLDTGKLATAVRTGLHRDPLQKIRVVIDLAKGHEVEHSYEYRDEGRLLLVRLLAVSAEPGDKTAASPPLPEKALSVEAADPATLPITERPVPEVFSLAEPVVDSSAESEALPGDRPSDRQSAVDLPSPIAAPPESMATLLGVSYDDSSNRGEMVLFHLTDFYPPKVAAIEKETPRVLCDFTDMVLADDLEKDIATGGRFVSRIRLVEDTVQQKIQVIIDLAPDHDYDLQQVFFKNDNLFVLIINELAAEGAAD